MDELVRWLSAQLDAEEDEARRNADAFGAVWTSNDAMECVSSDTGADVVSEPYAPRSFIAEHDPARVLREIDARRAVLTAYAEVAGNDVNEVEYAHGWANALGFAVRQLASAYSERPGYEAEEWAP